MVYLKAGGGVKRDWNLYTSLFEKLKIIYLSITEIKTTILSCDIVFS